MAIIDPIQSVAQAVLTRKQNSFVVSAYAATRLCLTLKEFVDTMKESERPDAIIVGSPPAFRGSVKAGRDVELEILKAFPNKTPAVSFRSFFFCLKSRTEIVSRTTSFSLRNLSVLILSKTLSLSEELCTIARRWSLLVTS